jgi:hypothetical protein
VTAEECAAAARASGLAIHSTNGIIDLSTSLPNYTSGCSHRINMPDSVTIHTGVTFNPLDTKYDGHSMKGAVAALCKLSQSKWNTVKFHTRFKAPPVVLANVQTDMSASTDPYNIRIRNVSIESFEFIIDEETDRAHVSEWVAYYAIGEPKYDAETCWLKAERKYNMNPTHVPHNASYAPPTCERYKALLQGAYAPVLNDTSIGCGGNATGWEEYRQLCFQFGCGTDCESSSSRRLFFI